jgi:CsoR family transcriptional regulator, copper-sensing transcriptional repressor
MNTVKKVNTIKKVNQVSTVSKVRAANTAAIAPEQVQALLSRLRRAEGQVRAVARLIEEGQSCDAVAQQLTAARKALDKAFYALVGCAVEHGQVAPNGVSDLLAKYA